MLPKSKDEKNLTKFHMYISTHDAAGAIVLGVPHKQPRGAPRMTYVIWLLCQQDSRFFYRDHNKWPELAADRLALKWISTWPSNAESLPPA